MQPAIDDRATTRRAREPYSYRADPAVPRFPDDRPLILFDGVCVLCSGFARFVLRHDRTATFRVAAAQSPLGQALYRHYGLDPVAFETNVVLDEGRAHLKLAAFVAVMRRLPWPWRTATVLGLLPRRVADGLYDRIARNRYAVFGRRDSCLRTVPGFEGRCLD